MAGERGQLTVAILPTDTRAKILDSASRRSWNILECSLRKYFGMGTSMSAWEEEGPPGLLNWSPHGAQVWHQP